jgi:hypothetical protein
MYPLRLRTLGNAQHYVNLPPSSLVSELREHARQVFGFPPESTLKLMYRAVVLEDSQTIASLNFTPDTFIIVNRIRDAAAPGPRPQPRSQTSDDDFNDNVAILVLEGVPEDVAVRILRETGNNLEAAYEAALRPPPPSRSLHAPVTIQNDEYRSFGQSQDKLEALIRDHPGVLPHLLEGIGQSQPELACLIDADLGPFLRMMGIPVNCEKGERSAPGTVLGRQRGEEVKTAAAARGIPIEQALRMVGDGTF